MLDYYIDLNHIMKISGLITRGKIQFVLGGADAGSEDRSFEYEINGSVQGTYLLHLITQYDKAVLQVVVKNQ